MAISPRRTSSRRHVRGLLIVGLIETIAAVSLHRAPAARRALAVAAPARARFGGPSPCARAARRGRTVGMSVARPEFARHDIVFDRFLLQRALQTQIFYLSELHDQPSSRFIGQFMGQQGLDTYHGFDGLTVEPEEYIASLLAAGPTTVQVRSSSGSVSWGGTPGNPYIERREPTVHDFVVYPDRLGAALLRIRDQIADELLHDLDVLAAADVAVVAGGVRAPLFPASALAESTPTRRATFDLLQKLTLHAAVKHVLGGLARPEAADGGGRGAQADGEKGRRPPAAEHAWLTMAFAQSGFLCGDHGYGAADKFLTALIAKDGSIAIRSAGGADDGAETIAVVSPSEIAHQILNARALLARHLKTRLAAVSENHTEHLRTRLERSLRAQFGG